MTPHPQKKFKIKKHQKTQKQNPTKNKKQSKTTYFHTYNQIQS